MVPLLRKQGRKIKRLGKFLFPDTDYKGREVPSTAGNVITVGAYDSSTNTLAPFSGRGYTWNTGQVKPDLVAPGVDITSCAPGIQARKLGNEFGATTVAFFPNPRK